MRERVVKIGQTKPLIGILSEPENIKNQHTAVILLNSGVMHRIGSCRMTVKIARAITEKLDLPCLRFDFSGIGDSQSRSGEGVDPSETAVREVREVMDYLEQTKGIKAFILYGLCSGGHTSCQVGLIDPRVKAIAQIDGYCYETARSYMHYYLPKILSLPHWLKQIRRFFTISKKETASTSLDANNQYFETPNFSIVPKRSTVATNLSTLMANGIDLYCIYTGKEPTYMYLNQYRDCFNEVNFGDQLSMKYMPEASHIISQPLNQKLVVIGITQWVKKITAREHPQK